MDFQLTVQNVSSLEQEAAQAGDADTVRDCQDVIAWLERGVSSDEVKTDAAFDRIQSVMREAQARRE